jgi:hypothetical protein
LKDFYNLSESKKKEVIQISELFKKQLNYFRELRELTGFFFNFLKNENKNEENELGRKFISKIKEVKE